MVARDASRRSGSLGVFELQAERTAAGANAATRPTRSAFMKPAIAHTVRRLVALGESRATPMNVTIHPSVQHRESWLCALLRTERKNSGKARVIVFVRTETAAIQLHQRLRKNFPSAVNAGQHASDGLARFREGNRLVLVTPDGRMPASSLMAQGAVSISWDPPSTMAAHDSRMRVAAVTKCYQPLVLHNGVAFTSTLNADYAHLLKLSMRRAGSSVPPVLEQAAAASQAARTQREAEQRAAAEQQRLAAEKRAREEAEVERQQQVEEGIKRRRQVEERQTEVNAKQLKVGDRVTALGHSIEEGDLVIRHFDARNGTVQVGDQSRLLNIDDPRILSRYVGEAESLPSMLLLQAAEDEYEAAVSLYHDANGAASNSAPPPSARPILEHRGEIQAFDEYKCAEKIDFVRLKRLLEDFSADRTSRAQHLQALHRTTPQSEEVRQRISLFEKLEGMDKLLRTLHTKLAQLPPDSRGCVVYEVVYEHKDPSGRERLFAVGELVKCGEKTRTATLQAMYKELRHPLVGAFAHDIDCQASDVRLLCSLANQLRLEKLVPTLFDYRDKREDWHRKIGVAYGVESSKAKRLPTIIISGGRIQTWLKKYGKQKHAPQPEVNQFAKRLSMELCALREQLFNHSRFKWIDLDRKKLMEQKGRKSPHAIEEVLLQRIVTSCENNVLSILHRTLESIGWAVRAKIFDGLITERSPRATSDLQGAIQACELECLKQGWDVKLHVPPLHGLQDKPLDALVQARAYMRAYSNTSV